MEEGDLIEGLDDEEDAYVALKCNDGVTVKCLRSSAMLSDLIKTTLEGGNFLYNRVVSCVGIENLGGSKPAICIARPSRRHLSIFGGGGNCVDTE